VTRANECPVNRLAICEFWTLSCQIKLYALLYLFIYSLHNNASTFTRELNQQCPETMSHSWQKLLSGDHFHWVENVPFSGGRELGPHLTKTRQSRGQPPYQVLASQSIQPFGHNGHGLKIGGLCHFRGEASPSNRDRQKGQTDNSLIAQGKLFYKLLIITSEDEYSSVYCLIEKVRPMMLNG